MAKKSPPANPFTDYLHLTKRFGSIAVSQFPLQYMLSLKAAAPLSIVCSSSHERINRFHRVLGRIIYLLLVCHGVLYLNYYMVTSKLKKLVSLVLLAGIGAMLLLTFLMLTSMASVRAYSYRIFFIIHLLAAFGVPLMLILHAGRHTAFFVAECLFVFVCDLIARKIGTFSAITSLKLLPGTNLIKIIVPVPENWKENFGRPGQHVYLSVPSPSRPHSLRLGLLFECLYNPFTIAKFDSDVNELTLVVRHRDGPMTEQLYQLVQAGSGHQSKAKGIKLSIEGPYGSLIPHFDRALNANRVLLVAGGVGATFILPIYVALKEHRTSESRVKFVWAVRQPSEATWAILSSSLDRKWPRSINTDRHSSRISPGESSGFPLQSSNSILDDNEVQLYLTGNLLSDMSSAENYIELSTINRGSNSSEWGNNNSRRPNLANMVNEIFRLGNEETIAIIVCGPRAMAREVRTAVTPWVAKGRDVFWHEESFGI